MLGNISWLVSLLTCSVLLFLMPRLLHRPLLSGNVFMAAASATVCLGTVLMHFSYGQDVPWLFFLASVLTGVGSAGMWGLWGQRYEKKTRSLGMVAPLSALVVCLFILFCWLIPEEASFVLCAALPLVSAALYLASARQDASILDPGPSPTPYSAPQAAEPESLSTLDRRKALTVLVKLCIFVGGACALCSFGRIAPLSADGEHVAVPSILAGMGIILLISWRNEKMNHTFDFVRPARWLLLLEVATFALLLSDLPFGTELAARLSFAISTCFDFLLFMCLTRVIQRGVFSSTVAFCISEGSVQMGWLLGDALSAVFVGVFGYATDLLRPLYALAVCLLFAIMLLIIDQQGNLRKLIGDRGNRESVESTSRAFHLSPRETEIAVLLSQGRSVPYISDELFLAKSTVETHVKHIYKKTGVHSRQELIDLLRS